MSECTLCPRNCRADRRVSVGYCGADEKVKIALVSAHKWEEPCVSGDKASATVFFSGCNLGCVYCQNYDISGGGVGKIYSAEELAEIFRKIDLSPDLYNINLVTPTHYLPQIVGALDIYQPEKPIVYNSSAYEYAENLERLRGRVSVFLPDYKYADSTVAAKYSNAPDYPEIALAAIDKMVDISPKPTFKNGIITSGVIVRHLVLPENTDNSMKCLRILHKRYGNSIYISIMKQYTPVNDTPYPELSRKVSDDEYQLVCDYADYLGIEQGYTQTGESVSESFIPDFDGQVHI